MNDFIFLRDKNDSNMPPLNRAELLKWLLDWKGDIVSQMTEAKEDGYIYMQNLIYLQQAKPSPCLSMHYKMIQCHLIKDNKQTHPPIHRTGYRLSKFT